MVSDARRYLTKARAIGRSPLWPWQAMPVAVKARVIGSPYGLGRQRPPLPYESAGGLLIARHIAKRLPLWGSWLAVRRD